jgi:hypothetical protein
VNIDDILRGITRLDFDYHGMRRMPDGPYVELNEIIMRLASYTAEMEVFEMERAK